MWPDKWRQQKKELKVQFSCNNTFDIWNKNFRTIAVSTTLWKFFSAVLAEQTEGGVKSLLKSETAEKLKQ